MIGVIWETRKIIFHWVFAFENFSLYIIHAFKNIRLWVVEKCLTLTSTLQSNLFTSCGLTDIHSQPPLHVLHLLLETSQEYHQQYACCKMSAILKLLYIITVKSQLNGKLTEWTGLQDERQQKWKGAEHSPLPAALWNPNCRTQWQSSSQPWAAEKTNEDELIFLYTHGESASNEVSNLSTKVWNKGLHCIICHLHIKHCVVIFINYIYMSLLTCVLQNTVKLIGTL